MLLLGMACFVQGAYRQELVTVVQEGPQATPNSVPEWRTFLRVQDYSGTAYVLLVQVAAILNGRLEPLPPSKSAQLSTPRQIFRFTADSPKVVLTGREFLMEAPALKNEDGFWVPLNFFSSPTFTQRTKARLIGPLSDEEQEASRRPIDRNNSANLKISSPPAAAAVKVDPPRQAKALRRIAIDPGHGGKDPGAIGPEGSLEKDINLRMALDLADSLREAYGYEVLLTRMDDSFVPLEERARLANKHHADLFISLHCNASSSPRRKGFEVYFLSERASDSHADAVARLENAVLALEGKELPTPSRLKQVLRSLQITANINEASAAGSLLDRHLSERLSVPSLGVKQAAFYVLRGAEMPAVLVEMAFVSNRHEERLLQSSSFRKKMVEGLAAGIAAYDVRKQKERT